MPEHDDLSAEAALREVDRAQGAVRKASRRGAYFFLGMWLGSTGYWLAKLLGPATVKNYASLAIGALIRGLLRSTFPASGSTVGCCPGSRPPSPTRSWGRP